MSSSSGELCSMLETPCWSLQLDAASTTKLCNWSCAMNLLQSLSLHFQLLCLPAPTPVQVLQDGGWLHLGSTMFIVLSAQGWPQSMSLDKSRC